MQQPRTHHRRQCQRDKPRHHHRRSHCQRKFQEQAPGVAGGKCQRRKHRSQRHRHRHHCKRNLPPAGQRRVDRRHAVFNVAVNILEHDDGVINHQADCEHDAQQCQHVDRETHHPDQEKCADQRHRNGHERNQRRPERPQEQENDQHHQRQCFGHHAVHRGDRLFDKHRGIEGHRDLHARRQRRAELGHFGLDRLRHRQRIRGGLLDDAQAHGRLAIDTQDVAFIGGAQFGAADIAQPHRVTLHVADDQLVELLRRAQIGFRQHGEFALAAFDAARGHFDVLPAQRVLDILRRQRISRQALAIEPDAHRVTPLPADNHRGHARQGLQTVGDKTIGIVRNLQSGMLFREQAQPDDGLRIRLDLGDDRLLDLQRQPVARARYAVAHVIRRKIGIAVIGELDGDLADFLAADRLQRLHAFDARDAVFQRLRDLRFDDLRTGAGVDGTHRDHRRIDLRVFTYGQAVKRNDADQDDQQAHHRSQHGALDGKLRQEHCATSSVPAWRPAR